MEIELHPAVSLVEETFNVLVAPVEMLVDALNSHLNLQRYKVLFVGGNYSRILSKLDRNFTELDVRRAFTSFQLMTILDENHHNIQIVEHDPMLTKMLNIWSNMWPSICDRPTLCTCAGSPFGEDD
jgi:DNA polymerase I